MTVCNLSFAAAGFLGIYHVGAAEAFLRHGDKLLGSLRACAGAPAGASAGAAAGAPAGACAGASAGAMVAAVMVTAPDKLQVMFIFALIPKLLVFPVNNQKNDAASCSLKM